MEKLPHQEYRDTLAEELNNFRKSDSKEKAQDHLAGKKQEEEYKNSKEKHVENVLENLSMIEEYIKSTEALLFELSKYKSNIYEDKLKIATKDSSLSSPDPEQDESYTSFSRINKILSSATDKEKIISSEEVQLNVRKIIDECLRDGYISYAKKLKNIFELDDSVFKNEEVKKNFPTFVVAQFMGQGWIKHAVECKDFYVELFGQGTFDKYFPLDANHLEVIETRLISESEHERYDTIELMVKKIGVPDQILSMPGVRDVIMKSGYEKGVPAGYQEARHNTVGKRINFFVGRRGVIDSSPYRDRYLKLLESVEQNPTEKNILKLDNVSINEQYLDSGTFNDELRLMEKMLQFGHEQSNVSQFLCELLASGSSKDVNELMKKFLRKKLVPYELLKLRDDNKDDFENSINNNKMDLGTVLRDDEPSLEWREKISDMKKKLINLFSSSEEFKVGGAAEFFDVSLNAGQSFEDRLLWSSKDMTWQRVDRLLPLFAESMRMAFRYSCARKFLALDTLENSKDVPSVLKSLPNINVTYNKVESEKGVHDEINIDFAGIELEFEEDQPFSLDINFGKIMNSYEQSGFWTYSVEKIKQPMSEEDTCRWHYRIILTNGNDNKGFKIINTSSIEEKSAKEIWQEGFREGELTGEANTLYSHSLNLGMAEVALYKQSQYCDEKNNKIRDLVKKIKEDYKPEILNGIKEEFNTFIPMLENTNFKNPFVVAGNPFRSYPNFETNSNLLSNLQEGKKDYIHKLISLFVIGSEKPGNIENDFEPLNPDSWSRINIFGLISDFNKYSRERIESASKKLLKKNISLQQFNNFFSLPKLQFEDPVDNLDFFPEKNINDNRVLFNLLIKFLRPVIKNVWLSKFVEAAELEDFNLDFDKDLIKVSREVKGDKIIFVVDFNFDEKFNTDILNDFKNNGIKAEIIKHDNKQFTHRVIVSL